MYQVTFTPEAELDLANLNKPIAQRVFKKIHWLADHFNLVMPEPLTGLWQGMYKLRVGDYRVIYTFDKNQQLIVIHVVKHRREVYKMR
jgi:mRNA interferase RelE/StbE